MFPKMLLSAIILYASALWSPPAGAWASEPAFCSGQPCEIAGLQAEAIAKIWPSERARLFAEIERTADPFADSTIYNLQLVTATLLEHAIETQNRPLIGDLEALYGAALDKYARQSNVYRFWEGYTFLGKNNWVERQSKRPVSVILAPGDRTESLLNTSQFMFAVARLAAGSQDPGIQQRFGHQIADFYLRIILGIEKDPSAGPFQRRGWGCFVDRTKDTERFSHLAFLRHLKARAFQGKSSYCNALTDTDVWMLAGAAQLFDLNLKAPIQTRLTAHETETLAEYLEVGAGLLRERTIPKTILHRGESYSGLTFDPGAYNDHPEMLWAGYEGAAAPWDNPELEPPAPPADLSWDISHGRRLVQLFESLHKIRGSAGLQFPQEADMAALARQVTIGIDRGAPGAPRFTNFLDASNGWYRVGYSNRGKFAYPPFSQNAAWIGSGYCRLARYAPEAREVCAAVLHILTSEQPEDHDKHETLYRPCVISHGARTLCPPMTRRSASPQWLRFVVSLDPPR